jgi:hypothetical protein
VYTDYDLDIFCATCSSPQVVDEIQTGPAAFEFICYCCKVNRADANRSARFWRRLTCARMRQAQREALQRVRAQSERYFRGQLAA